MTGALLDSQSSLKSMGRFFLFCCECYIRITFNWVGLYLIFKSDTVLTGDFIDRMMSDLPFIQPAAWCTVNPPAHPIARVIRTNPFLIYGGTREIVKTRSLSSFPAGILHTSLPVNGFRFQFPNAILSNSDVKARSTFPSYEHGISGNFIIINPHLKIFENQEVNNFAQ